MKAHQMRAIEIRLNSPDWRVRADAKQELDEDDRQGNEDMTTLQPITYKLPAYWASYLINGDSSGLQPGEQETIDAWCDDRGLGGRAVDCGESFFHWRNDATTLGGDVCQYTFLVPVTAESAVAA